MVVSSGRIGRIRIRRATSSDVPFVAKCILAAVDLYDFKEDSIERDVAEHVCAMDGTLYSWRNAKIAEVDGRTAGCLVAYDGAIYPEGRERTFAEFRKVGREIPPTGMETGPGEYYLDSMAIVPEYRGHGIGHALMSDAISDALRRGMRRISLIVECSKPALRDYYAKLGFVAEREMDAFGDRYLRMVLEK